tara:strand:+ start:2903 stop:3202 length:300 start_codon:yes stop_codon:yes gene_type:complete
MIGNIAETTLSQELDNLLDKVDWDAVLAEALVRVQCSQEVGPPSPQCSDLQKRDDEIMQMPGTTKPSFPPKTGPTEEPAVGINPLLVAGGLFAAYQILK